MNQFSISVDKLFDGDSFLSDQKITVTEGIISSIEPISEPDASRYSGALLPGFIDVQVNGGGGVLFNHSPNLESLTIIAKAHQTYGTTGWLPTLVTDKFENMQKAADSVAEAIKKPNLGVLGIHFEGPHLCLDKRGVHASQFIRKLSNTEKALYSRQDLGKVVVTLAPEVVDAELISELVELDVIVCLGHSNATYHQVETALSAGATGFTHLFNAMSQFNSREPGMVGAALKDKSSYAGLILDGYHVHPASAKVAIENKENMMLVTDAMPPVATNQSHFEFFGENISVNGGKLTNSKGKLAGSALNMNLAVNNAVELADISVDRAINMATLKPAQFLGVDSLYSQLKVGYKANMVIKGELNQITDSWIEGEKVL